MSKKIYKSSIGFLDLLLILFIGLKLGNVINWSWWWVFSPIWLPLCIIVFTIAFVFLVSVLIEVINPK